jgi:hypothetical protein
MFRTFASMKSQTIVARRFPHRICSLTPLVAALFGEFVKGR